MPKVVLKRSSVSSNAPTTNDLDYGELALNYADGRLYYKTSSNAIDYFSTGTASDFENYQYTATASQTTFSGSDDNSNTLSYTAGQITVFVNGIKLAESDYTATNGTSVVLASAASLNDNVEIVSFINLKIATFEYTATSSQTTFSGTDDNSNLLKYNVGDITVYLNGVKLAESDYTATNGTSVVLGSGAALNDILEVVIYKNLNSQVLDFAGDTGTGTIFLGDDTLTIAGTANEITTSVSGETVTIGLPSSITVDVTGSLTGNADTATKLSSTRTFALTGDVTGTVDSDLTSGISISTTISGLDTDSVNEGSTNLYYTDTRARAAISVTDSGGDGSLSYDNSTGVITYTGPSASEVRAHLSAGTGLTFTTGEFAIDSTVATLTGTQTLTNKTIDAASNTLSNIANSSLTNNSITINGTSVSLGGTRTLVTDDIAEDGSPNNLWYTDARSRAAISVTDSGGDGSLSYNSSTGVLTYTGPSASEVRAHFTGGTGVTITNGEIAIGQAVATNSNVTFNDVTISGDLTVSGTTTTVNTETINLADNIILLNSNEAGTPSQNSGIEVERGTSTNATLLWDETNDYWIAGSSGSEERIVVGAGNTSITTLGTISTGTWQGTSISTTYTDAKVTSVNASTGIDVSGTTGAVTVSVDVSDFMTNGSNNRVLTATGTDAMNAEANLTFDGSTLAVTGDLNVGSGDFFVDDSSGRVGIGTSSPSTLVDAVNSANDDVVSKVTNANTGSVATAQFFASNGTTTTQFFHTGTNYVGGGVLTGSDLGGVYNTTSNGLAFVANNASAPLKFAAGGTTERMRIDSSGRVGIGVTPSAWSSEFPVLQSGDHGAYITGRNTYNQLFIGANSYYDGSDWKHTTTDVATRYYQSTGEHVWDTAVSNTAGGIVSWSESMRIDSSGNVGIGTTSPAQKLEVVGSGGTISGNGRFVSRILENKTNYKGVGFGYDTSGQIGLIFADTAAAASSLAFWTYNGSSWGERVRFASSGVGIGTTSPSAPLNIVHTNLAADPYTGIVVKNTSTTGAAFTGITADAVLQSHVRFMLNGSLKWQWRVGAGSGVDDMRLYSWTAAADVMKIDNTGNVGIGTTSPAQKLHVVGEIVATSEITAYYSDERLKTKVNDVTNALDIVKNLNAFRYVNNETANSFGFNTDELQLGLSAQEVQKVVPEIVKLAPFDMERDENDNLISKSGEYYLTLDYAKLVPVLIEAIKEQQKMIEELQAKEN